MRKAEIKMQDTIAGLLIRDENGYHFTYDTVYINAGMPEPVSKTLPLQADAFHSKNLFPFFDGLIPEGWLLNIAEKNWKLDAGDRMGLLLACCKDCLGAVSVHPVNEEANAG
jgi:serine/threonine-protein kinase HipA